MLHQWTRTLIVDCRARPRVRQITSYKQSKKFPRPSFLLGGDVAALLHEAADGEPHRVAERELVDEHLGLVVAGVRVVPLVGAEPGQDEKENGDPEVGRGRVDPDVQ